jgi:hypothetical protein
MDIQFISRPLSYCHVREFSCCSLRHLNVDVTPKKKKKQGELGRVSGTVK